MAEIAHKWQCAPLPPNTFLRGASTNFRITEFR
jgi:hypothetical protein